MTTLLILLLVSGSTGKAQEERLGGTGPRFGTRRPSDEWTPAWRLRSGFAYTSNVWSLDDDSKDRLDGDVAADETSGRYRDMDSSDDFLVNPDIRIDLEGSSPLGGKLELWTSLEYTHYALNPRKSFFELDLGADQDVGRDGVLGFAFGFDPEMFSRNYLEDATDLTGSNSVAERRYSPGEYRRWSVEVDYRHDLVRRRRGRPWSMDGGVAFGYRNWDYVSPFSGRGRAAPYVRLELDWGYEKTVRWGIHYEYETVGNSPHTEILLLDEPDFGLDLNGDGDAIDPNARTFQRVDRSYDDHEFGFHVRVIPDSKWEFGGAFVYLLRGYTSEEILDVSHRDRDDERIQFELSTRHRFTSEWAARLEVAWRIRDTDRPGDPDLIGDEGDYRRNVISLAVTYRF